MAHTPTSPPRTVETIFSDFCGRRAGIIQALTMDVSKFFALCDPGKENLCLFGYPDGTWEVSKPSSEVPTELPEPSLGINFARDGMKREDWIALICIHSDSWLMSIAFFYGVFLTYNDRKRLFGLINNLPTVYETVTGRIKIRDRPNSDNGSNSKINEKISSDGELKTNPSSNPLEKTDENDSKHDDFLHETLCGFCESIYNSEEFWIGCDVCDKWYHGATPKGILKAMALPGLTIYHVKSHLQKYRISKFIPESSDKGMLQRRKVSEMLPNFSATSGAQIKEALQMHMEVQRRMSDQYEVQRLLKVGIEAQGRYLERIADKHQNSSGSDIKVHRPYSSPKSLPSLCESESNGKDYESDSEVDINGKSFDQENDHFENLFQSTNTLPNVLQQGVPTQFSLPSTLEEEMKSEEIRSRKRLRVDDMIFPPSFELSSNNLQQNPQKMLKRMFHPKEAEISNSMDEIAFPWMVTSSESSPISNFCL